MIKLPTSNAFDSTSDGDDKNPFAALTGGVGKLGDGVVEGVLDGGGLLRDSVTYRGWDGKPWTTRWKGDAFVHTSAGAKDIESSAINYVTWDGTQWSAVWDTRANCFNHSTRNRKRASKHLNYLDVNGRKFTAMREGNRFMVTS